MLRAVTILLENSSVMEQFEIGLKRHWIYDSFSVILSIDFYREKHFFAEVETFKLL